MVVLRKRRWTHNRKLSKAFHRQKSVLPSIALHLGERPCMEMALYPKVDCENFAWEEEDKVFVAFAPALLKGAPGRQRTGVLAGPKYGNTRLRNTASGWGDCDERLVVADHDLAGGDLYRKIFPT